MPQPDQIQRAFDKAREYVVSGHLPMVSVSIANREGVTARKAFDGDGNEDASLQNRSFALASITKAIVSVAVARLYEQGVIDYDAPIGGVYPELGYTDERRAITLANVFTHTPGLPTPFNPATEEINYSSEASWTCSATETCCSSRARK